GTFLDRAAGLDAVTVGQRILDLPELRQNLGADVGRLHTVENVATHGEHEIAVATPQDWLLEFVVEACNLRQRHRDAVSGGYGESRQTAKLEALVRDGTCHHVDVLDALTILGNGES